MTTFQRIIVGKKFKEIQVPSESIYNLLPNSSEIPRNRPRYQSKFTSSTKKFYESVKKSHQTMGFPKIHFPSPKKYLRKHSQENKRKIETKPFSCLDKQHKKPPIPQRGDEPFILREKSEKDFIKMNVSNVLRKPAVKPVRKTVDTLKGDSFLLEFSGLVPKFSMKEEFGKTPRYLVQRKKDLDYSNEMCMKSFAEEKPAMLSKDDKNSLIEGLRTNWEELNKRYLSLPLVVDTKVLKNRKLELERKLNLLEHDIYFLEKNKDVDIYVLPE